MGIHTIMEDDVTKGYNTNNGRITDPGKFEGEMIHVPYFWDIFLQGLHDGEGEDGEIMFDIMPSDRERFPWLRDRSQVILKEDGQGFVWDVS